MNLVRAEAQRLLARRFTWVMLLMTVGILGLVLLGIALNSHRPTPAVVAQAEQRAAEQRAQFEQMRADCERFKRDPASAPPGYPSDAPCDRMFDISQVRAEDFMPHTFGFRAEVPTLLGVLGGIVALFGFAVGASFVGAEWHSGGMTNLLLWRPRRVLVLLTKLGTVIAGVLALGAVAGAGYLAALWIIAQTRGRVGAVDAGFWQSLGLTAARALALAMAAAAIGFALASLGRHTATALGVGVGYLIVGQVGMSIVLGLTEVARPERFQLSGYVTAWVNNGATFQDYSSCLGREGPCEPQTWTIGLADAATVGSVILVLLLGAATWQMARRDVT
jgi:ABC-type transport system involved in multi-copper enzyme maturation permease subunit